MERNLINERIKEGVAVAKRCEVCRKTRDEHSSQSHQFKNKYLGRAPAIRANNGKLETFQTLVAQGAKISEIARQIGVSRQTVYAHLAGLAESTKEEAAA
jgi:DNA invertase Pin-like site-specific DNA recombinase